MMVRSSSVSRPSISSRTCLPHAAATSRTRRGSLFQRLPIGCMRVFMIPSCSSVVMRLSRCVAAGASRSVLGRDVLEHLVAREHQLADEIHQEVEQVHVHADVRLGDGRGGSLAARDERFQNVLRLERAVVDEDLADPARIAQPLLLGREHHRVGIKASAFDQRIEQPAADRPWRGVLLVPARPPEPGRLPPRAPARGARRRQAAAVEAS